MRISVDLPAPLGPSRPYIPGRNREGHVLQRLHAVGIGLGYAANLQCHSFSPTAPKLPSQAVAVLVDLERQAGFRHFDWEGLAFPANYLDCFRL